MVTSVSFFDEKDIQSNKLLMKKTFVCFGLPMQREPYKCIFMLQCMCVQHTYNHKTFTLRSFISHIPLCTFSMFFLELAISFCSTFTLVSSVAMRSRVWIFLCSSMYADIWAKYLQLYVFWSLFMEYSQICPILWFTSEISGKCFVN